MFTLETYKSEEDRIQQSYPYSDKHLWVITKEMFAMETYKSEWDDI